MTLSFPVQELLSWIGLLAALAVAVSLAAAIGRRDDGPPPDDMDERPSQ